jgi:hypothetical protein
MSEPKLRALTSYAVVLGGIATPWPADARVSERSKGAASARAPRTAGVVADGAGDEEVRVSRERRDDDGEVQVGLLQRELVRVHLCPRTTSSASGRHGDTWRAPRTGALQVGLHGAAVGERARHAVGGARDGEAVGVPAREAAREHERAKHLELAEA